MEDSFPVSLEEWNVALVKSFFLKSSHAGLTLSRIDTTGRIFEQLAGSRTKEDAKQSFLDAFGKDASRIQKYLYGKSQLDILAKNKGYPTCFAILYLTLLAASADDDTHEEGDFRVRFSVLLGFDKGKKFNFEKLPKLWERIEKWSYEKQNCSRFILPVPSKNEPLIGYSKRIAFPSYKDEVFLRNILFDNKFDHHLTFDSVNKVVHQCISRFGEVFKKEFFEFRSLLAKADMQKAYYSPFWGAVRDIATYIEKEQVKENGKYCIQLDFSDPEYPEIYLLMDDIAVATSGISSYHPLLNNIDDYNNIYYEGSLNITLNALVSLLKSRGKNFLNSRVGAALLSGCLPLFRDSFGYISSDGEYYDNSPLYLILHHEYANSICSVLKNTIEMAQKIDIKSAKWAMIFFNKVSRQSLDKIASLLPAEASRFLIQGWRPAKPYMTDMARFGQAVLLNPASTPLIHMDGAIGGSYIISNSNGDELISGSLVQASKGLFIPSEKLIEISDQTFCRYELTLVSSNTPVIFDVHVLDHAPYAGYREITEPQDWLTDGPLGTLIPLDDSSTIDPVKQEKMTPLSGSQPLWQYENNLLTKCGHVELHDIPAVFDWLAEALALRFQRRSTLPFSELKRHIELVSQATSIPAWKLRRTLFAIGWFRVVQRRHAPYLVLSLAKRTISVDAAKQGAIARVMGMFTRSERNYLQEALQSRELIRRWLIADNSLSIGCIELHLSDTKRAHDFIEKFELHLINRDDFPINPLSGVLQPLSQMQRISILPSDVYISLWQTEKHQWSEERPVNIADDCILMRCREKQRYRYYIRQRSNYWQTDSFTWALMAHVMYSEGKFGIRNGDSDWNWSTKIIALPPSVIQWWVHIAGGCLSITDDGSFLFAGGKKPLWNHMSTEPFFYQAIARRNRALAMRKMANLYSDFIESGGEEND
ncbi:hypothetical protein [Photorhabdus heterorhabditis]|uniref:Uncharacterized protein n=1 Tax=Photorhabdus heterorhabditis TaxID=880156 RepID=A0A5B0W5V8_9GAMM|nr:hypothetical protein [Photorhabdus heterorhabditis]KAA1181279.1 hypothetical protein F0L16_17135 [Photorhabdus heterorhabditis]